MTDQEGQPPRAVRLTFSYDADGIQLVSRQAVTMRVPPGDDPTAPVPATGFAAELRTPADDTTFRRVLHDAIPRDVEVFDPDLQRGMARAPVTRPSGVFTVLVPDDGRADEVVLLAGREDVPPSFDVPPEADVGPGPVEVGRFRLREGGQGGSL